MLGGCSCIVIGDFGQLPPVMDSALFTTASRNELSDLGSACYHLFDRAVVLQQVMRQAGENPEQKLFRDILMRLRNGQVTQEDWKHLMKQTPAEVGDTTVFDEALRLFPTVELTSEYNSSKLRTNGQAVAVIKAVHSGEGAAKAKPDEAGGLEPVVCLAHGARVMLTANVWTQVGLVNGAVGTVVAICYNRGQSPPSLPVAVTVKFDSYTGPVLPDGTVPITPLHRTWFSTRRQCSRLQLPLKLSWAVTIHKSQGMTLDKVVVNVGKKEFCPGLTFVACSRVRRLADLLFVPPFPYDRVANLGRKMSERLHEDLRLHCMSTGQPLPTPAPPTRPHRSNGEGNGSIPTSEPNVPTSEHDSKAGPSTAEEMVAEGRAGNLPTPPSSENGRGSSLPDVFITGTDRHTLRYHPVDTEWQQNACHLLGITYHRPNGVTPGGPTVRLTYPHVRKRIRGDGNCMFRSFSFIITGSEEEHLLVRRAIVSYMRDVVAHRIYASQVWPQVENLNRHNPTSWSIGMSATDDYRTGMEKYIAGTRMDRSGSWGTEVELIILSHMLNTPIAIFHLEDAAWQKHYPCSIDSAIQDEVDPNQQMMYIAFEVITTMWLNLSCESPRPSQVTEPIPPYIVLSLASFSLLSCNCPFSFTIIVSSIATS